MDLNALTKLSKSELLAKCEVCGLTKYKSKNKSELIELINSKKNIEFIIEDSEETNIVVNLIDIIGKEEENVVISATVKQPHLKPIIKWSGGKSDEIKMFEKYFPKHYDKYIEPFVGGGAVYFYLNPTNAVIGDVHTELINLYTSIGKGKSQQIYDFMKITPNDEKTYYEVRDKMEINDEFDSAKRFYYQRKTCFRGMLRYNKNGKFNIPFGRYKTINYSDLANKDYETLLNRTEILNKNFEYKY